MKTRVTLPSVVPAVITSHEHHDLLRAFSPRNITMCGLLKERFDNNRFVQWGKKKVWGGIDATSKTKKKAILNKNIQLKKIESITL